MGTPSETGRVTVRIDDGSDRVYDGVESWSTEEGTLRLSAGEDGAYRTVATFAADRWLWVESTNKEDDDGSS